MNKSHENLNCNNSTFVININQTTKQNKAFLRTCWTGKNLQLTVMSIPTGHCIGIEQHNVDQLIQIEEGYGIIKTGKTKSKMDFERKIDKHHMVIIPAGLWHNIINTGSQPLKLFSIYAPPQHPHNTLYLTKKDATTHKESKD